MAVSHVATAAWSENTSGAYDASFQIDKPSGATTGDLLVAVVTVSTGYSGNNPRTTATFNAITGWTKVAQQVCASTGLGDDNFAMCVYVRDCQSGDPANWSGTMAATTSSKVSVCMAYRGVDVAANQFIDHGFTFTDPGAGGAYLTPLVSDSVTNSDVTAWRVVVGTYMGSATTATSSSWNDTSRSKSAIAISKPFGVTERIHQLAADSNAPVAASSSSRSLTIGADNHSGFGAGGWISWIGIVKGLDLASTGTIAVTGPSPTTAYVADVNLSTTLAFTGPSPQYVSDGFKEMPADGILGVVGPIATVTINVAAPAFSVSMSLVGPIASSNIIGNTRPFGPRVVYVRPESRTQRIPNVPQSS